MFTLMVDPFLEGLTELIGKLMEFFGKIGLDGIVEMLKNIVVVM